jgi:ribosomal protein S18 acetylase RimI-like enzyme
MIKIVEKSDNKYIEEILELEKKVFGENGAIDIWNLKPYVKYGRVFVYLERDKVVAVVEIMKTWQEDKVYLYGLCVDVDYRGQGIGNKFMLDIFRYLKVENIKLVELTVAPENVDAIKLYEKIGFERKEFLENEYGEDKNRYLYMKKIVST